MNLDPARIIRNKPLALISVVAGTIAANLAFSGTASAETHCDIYAAAPGLFNGDCNGHNGGKAEPQFTRYGNIVCATIADWDYESAASATACYEDPIHDHDHLPA